MEKCGNIISQGGTREAAIEASEAAVKKITIQLKKHVKETMRPEVMGGLGGFSGAFSLAAIKNMENPVLLSGTDGCGTKVKLAFIMDKHDTVGMMVYKCREFSDNLVQDIDLILKNIQAINNASTVTSEKSTIVRELLTKLVAFCDANKYDINEEVVERIVQMLQTVIGAFKHLDTSISITNESSVRIDNSVSELTRLVEELNVMLHETTNVDKY